MPFRVTGMVRTALFAEHTSRQAEGLTHLHRTIFRVALAGSHVFAWLFVFQHFYFTSLSVALALAATLIVYAFTHALTLLLTPLSAAFLRQGAHRSMMFGGLFAASALLMLGSYVAGSFPGIKPEWVIFAFAVFMGFYRTFYWVPYHVSKTETHFGPSSSLLIEILIAIVPACAGVLLSFGIGGALGILYGAAALVVLSLLPLSLLPEVHERFSWSYRDTYRELFSPRNRLTVLHAGAQGVTGAALLLLWPLMIFLIIGADYNVFGAILSISLLAILFFRIILDSRLVRHIHASPALQTLFGLSGWVLRLGAYTPTTFIIADVYAHVSAPSRGSGLDLSVTEQAADLGRYLDEYTVLKDMGNMFGRIGFALIGVALLLLTSFETTVVSLFTCAALISAIAQWLSAR